MQGTRVRALVWEDPTCSGATKPVSHNYVSHNYEPVHLEPVLRNGRGRDSERPWQWEAVTVRGRDSERPAHRDEEWPPLATAGESPRTEMKTQHSQK